MTTGTKVFLALFAVIVGVLVVYYGAIVPKKNPTNEAPAREPVVASDAGKTRESSGTTHSAGGAGAAPASPRTSPPPRQPAAMPPQSAPTSAGASTAGGLLSEGVREATGGQPPANPQSMAVRPNARNAMPLIANPLLPLVGLNGGDFTPTGRSNIPNQGVAEPASVPPANGTTPRPAGGAPSRVVTPGAPAAPARTEYVIASDDTFVSIAEAWFGDASKWSLIARENPTVDPQRLKIGQRIFLPPKSVAIKTAPPQPLIAAGETIHTVESGETLIAIARETLGDVARWDEIYRLNREAIGADPAALKVGMRLRLPKRTH